MDTKAISRVVMVMCIVAGVVGAARGETVVLAYTGEPAPDGNGSYLTFTDPVLNLTGRLAFRAKLLGTNYGTLDDKAIFRVDSGGATVICHEGWPTPDYNGWFLSLSSPAMNNASQVTFRGDAHSTMMGFFDSVGIYRGIGGGSPTRIFRGNDPAPDGNGRFLIMDDDETLFDDDVATISWASFTDTSGGYTDDTAIVVNCWGLSYIFAREGQTVPNGNGNFSGFRHIAANKDQYVAFLGDMRSTSGGSTDNTAIFRVWYTDTSLVELVREGDAPPDGNGKYQSFSLSPTLDNIGDGRIGFRARLSDTSGGTDDDSGIFLGTEFGVVRIARENQSPPDGNGQYSNFDTDIAQNDSWVAFRAWLRNTSGGPVDEEGLYRGNGITTKKIIRGGEPSPDGNGVFRSFWDIVMNKPGQIAFLAQLSGTAGGSSDNRGIFIGDGFDTVQAAREGDPLLGSTIVELHLATGPDCRNGLNNLAQVAYRAVLADGREVLVLYTPELQWKGGTGAWAVAVNWTLSILPDKYYKVAIKPRGSVDVTGPRTNAMVKSLTIGSTGGGTATLNLTSNGDLTALEEVAIGADGHILVGAGRALSALSLLNEGILTLDGAAVRAGALNNKGTLRGLGAITASVMNTGGILRPGDSPGTLNINGDYTQDGAATLEIELDGVGPREFDILAVTGEVCLSGTLELLLGFTPGYGDEFEIMTYASLSGEFDTVLGGDISPGLWFDLDYGPTSLTLEAVPEPAALSLLAIGALALIRRRRAKGD